MTTRRTPTPPPAPLPARIRAALATGWHSLSALDVLAGGAASTRRARVHAALAELAGAGMVREERMGPEGVEVREGVAVPTVDENLDAAQAELAAILPAPVPPAVTIAFTCNRGPCPDPGPGRGCHCRAARGFAFQSDDWCNCACHIGATIETVVHAAAAPTLPAPVPDDGSGWGTPAPDEPLSPAEEERSLALRMADECTPAELDELRALEARETAARAARLQQEAERAEEPRAPTPGPSSRCAVCNVTFARHADRAHPFTPKRRGPPPGPRQRRTPGPIVDVVSEARIERAGGPRLAPVGAEGGEERRMREGAHLDTRPAPTEAERAVVTKVEAAIAPSMDPAPCTPSSCHWQRIHEPARVAESELPPLCEEHRGRWRVARGAAVNGQRSEER